jgi:hypothetical protein
MTAAAAAFICPTAKRPHNARRLAEKFGDTVSGPAALILAIDGDDPELAAYLALRRVHPWVKLEIIADSPHRIGPIINQVTKGLLDGPSPPGFIGFLGDDHLPRTWGWNSKLARALDGEPGVAYGNDLHQREQLPTACLISAELVAALGFFVPPGMWHLYLDDFWKRLGQATRLAYCDNVIVQHLHPNYEPDVPVDATYAAAGCNPAVYAHDKTAWDAFLQDRDEEGRTAWDRALDRLAPYRQAFA